MIVSFFFCQYLFKIQAILEKQEMIILSVEYQIFRRSAVGNLSLIHI